MKVQKFLWSLFRELKLELNLITGDLKKISLRLIVVLTLIAGSFYLFKTYSLEKDEPVKQPQVLAIDNPNFTQLPTPTEIPAPVLTGKELPPAVTAQAALVMDVTSGKVIFEKNANKRIFPASTTKIMTAMVAVENYDIDDVVTVKTASNIPSLMNLANGEQLTVRSLLTGLLMVSANDAAISLASDNSMLLSTFIGKMNEKAQSLGMVNTQFTNPSGLHSISHYSTAFDLAALTKYALQNPVFKDIVGTKSKIVTDISGTKKHTLFNINRLVQEGYADGVKTGTTPQAGENVIATRTENGHRLIVVVIDSQNRFQEAKNLLVYSFKNFGWK